MIYLSIYPGQSDFSTPLVHGWLWHAGISPPGLGGSRTRSDFSTELAHVYGCDLEITRDWKIRARGCLFHGTSYSARLATCYPCWQDWDAQVTWVWKIRARRCLFHRANTRYSGWIDRQLILNAQSTMTVISGRTVVGRIWTCMIGQRVQFF